MSGPATSPAMSPQGAAADILAAALAGLETSSSFQSMVTVDGAVATSLVGRTIGTSTSLVATTSGRSVEYIRIPPNAWAREPDAEWLIVDSDQAPQSPLAALAAPLTLEPSPTGDGTLQATYPAAALGLEGDPAQVDITISGASITFRYEQTTNGRAVVSTTTLGPATDTTPIVAPSAAP